MTEFDIMFVLGLFGELCRRNYVALSVGLLLWLHLTMFIPGYSDSQEHLD